MEQKSKDNNEGHFFTSPKNDSTSKCFSEIKDASPITGKTNDNAVSQNKSIPINVNNQELNIHNSLEDVVKNNLVESDGLRAFGSEISLGFPKLDNDNEDTSTNLTIRDGPDLYQTILQTTCAFAIRCSHGQIPVQKLKNHQGFWLPHAYANENEKYLKTIDSIYEWFLNEFKNNLKSNPIVVTNENEKFLTNIQLYNIYRFQIPDGQFISRYIFLARWSGLDPRLVCCKDTSNLRWLSLDNIVEESKNAQRKIEPNKIIDILWGNEIIMVASVLRQQHLGKISHFRNPNILEFTSTEVLQFVNQNPMRSLLSYHYQMILNETKFSERDIIKIYCDYVQHCFPSMSMTYCSFSEYFTKMDFLKVNNIDNLRHIFRAFSKNRNIILFQEFLLGLAALDSNSSNSQFRCSYIFRYYDQNSDDFLEEDDFRRICKDIREKANLSLNQNEIENDVKKKLLPFTPLDKEKRIRFDSFISEASKGRIEGLELLFRLDKPLMETIHTRHLYQYIINITGKPFETKLLGTCPKCRPKSYSLAYHAVKLNEQGRIDESKPLINLNCGDLDAELHFKKKANEMQIKHSIEIVFNENSVANKVLAIVRRMIDFNELPREKKIEVSKFVNIHLTVDLIGHLCKEVKEIFLIEPRVLKLNTPCIVMGDIHGNINDLLTYERQLWSLAPSSNAPNVLFLGDYVDRGDYSIEVISYLFAMKILAPNKFFLLRGNHEIRSIQRNFTFARECIIKYSIQYGQRVFEEFNSAFDHLPLVGIIDESIFCAHGGIPYSINKIEELYKIPTPLDDPENQSQAAWEILWSDPITDEEYAQIREFKKEVVDTGYTENIRRSTAYYFTEKALRNFLKENNLSHVIRAHELQPEGYRFHHSGLLITVFSSSRYCRSNNKSAAVFVNSRGNEGFLKVIALET